ncbi:MAG TPA: helix-turn-helix domain-containing protein [Nevskiaceae bacterium]|nr:helix-turn-helix domain-containing protein [Nevskiaceae bacterium]
MIHRFSTDTVRPSESIPYWVDAVCQTYVTLDCEPLGRGSGQPFRGEIEQHGLSTVEVSVVSASPQVVVRTPALIRRSLDEYFIVSVQRRGRSRVTQDDRCADLQPGDFTVYDSTRPYTLAYPEGVDQFVLKIPRRQLAAQLPGIDARTAIKVCGRRGAGHLMLDMIETLLRDIDQVEPVSRDAVAQGLVAILSAGLRTLDCGTSAPPSTLGAYHLQRIKRYALDHLGDPELSVRHVAAALGMSSSHLYRSFDREGTTLGDWIWAQRLERCRRDLADPRLAKHSVIQIAFRWGFTDASHLSRAFKRAFGMTPREFRARNRPATDD